MLYNNHCLEQCLEGRKILIVDPEKLEKISHMG